MEVESSSSGVESRSKCEGATALSTMEVESRSNWSNRRASPPPPPFASARWPRGGARRPWPRDSPPLRTTPPATPVASTAGLARGRKLRLSPRAASSATSPTARAVSLVVGGNRI
jgi:hypothetical protein